MYTVKDLIEALQKCPEDYKVYMCADGTLFDLVSVGIDHTNSTVDLFNI